MADVNGITSTDINTRMKEIAKSDPIDPVATKRDITFYSAVRNNIMLDKVLTNQNEIIENQNKIMQKFNIGENLDIKG